MKMMMPLLSPAAGAIAFSASEGQPLLAGELIATLDLVGGGVQGAHARAGA
jgi:biotin carboxyl carrier protein